MSSILRYAGRKGGWRPGALQVLCLVGLVWGLALSAPPCGRAQAQDLLEQADPLDPQLADAYVQGVFLEEMEDQYEQASAVYLHLLGQMGTAAELEDRQVLAQQLAQLALVMPPLVLHRVFVGDLRGDPESWVFTPDAGALLQAWWRRQDPRPATPRNERLEEHLQRVAWAEARYARSDRTTDLDARGEVYVRYGEPGRKAAISTQGSRVVHAFGRSDVPVALSDFPESEFWVYDRLGEAGYFLFVRGGEGFRLAGTRALLPEVLYRDLTPHRADLARALLTLRVLESVYEQLAQQHPAFAARYEAVLDYRLELEAAGVSTMALPSEDARPDALALHTPPDRSPELEEDPRRDLDRSIRLPQLFIRELLARVQEEDRQAAALRRERLPQYDSAVLRGVERLPVAFRTARFLEPDGTTRTEVYWAPAPSAPARADSLGAAREAEGVDLPGEALVEFTAVQLTADYRRRNALRRRYRAADLLGSAGSGLTGQASSVTGDTARYHLALEWDVYPAAAPADTAGAMPERMAVRWLDSLTALSPDQTALELSDLRPLVVEDPASLDEEGYTPYPFVRITPETSLALYFEVYHLTFGADDQTHYLVEYEVQRSGDGPRYLGSEDDRTAVQASYTSSSRTAADYILLDLSAWRGEGPLDVTVRVTDETTGQRAERSIRFELSTNED